MKESVDKNIKGYFNYSPYVQEGRGKFEHVNWKVEYTENSQTKLSYVIGKKHTNRIKIRLACVGGGGTKWL